MFFFPIFEIVPLLVIALIVFAVASVASDRRDVDPSGRRGYTTYLVVVMFVALFVALFSATAVIAALVRIPLDDDGSTRALTAEGSAFGGGYAGSFGEVSASVAPLPVQASPLPSASVAPAPVQVSPVPGTTVAPFAPASPFAPPPSPIVVPRPLPPESVTYEGPLARYDPDREQYRQAIQMGLLMIAALVVLGFHARRLRELLAEPTYLEGPGRRSYQAYLYVVCALAVIIGAVAAAVALFALIRAIAPATFSSVQPRRFERNDALQQLATAGFLALASLSIFAVHWRRTAPLRPPAVPPLPPGEGPPAPPSGVIETGPP